jgi:hypothetical protein
MGSDEIDQLSTCSDRCESLDFQGKLPGEALRDYPGTPFSAPEGQGSIARGVSPWDVSKNVEMNLI